MCSATQSCLTLCNPMVCSPPDSSVQGIILGKNIGVGCDFLLQRIFLTQELNPCLLHLLVGRHSLPLSHWENPCKILGSCNMGQFHSLSLEKEMATHSSILPGKSHGWRNLVDYSPWGCKESDTTE